MNKILSKSDAKNLCQAFEFLECNDIRGLDMRFAKGIVIFGLHRNIRVIGTAQDVADEHYESVEAFAKAYEI